MASATQQCQGLGYTNGVAVVVASIVQNGQYYRRRWHAFYSATFICSEEGNISNPQPTPTNLLSHSLGSNDNTLNFFLIKSRVSWYQAQMICRKNGMRVPTWAELSYHFDYLQGQQVDGVGVDYLLQYYMCAMKCYNYVWVSDEFVSPPHLSPTKEWAFYLTAAEHNKMDPQPMPKNTRYGAFCVR